MSFLRKLFGTSQPETPIAPPPAGVPVVPKAKRLLVFPESDADVEAIRAADPISGEFNFQLRAALLPRSDPALAAARARRKPPSGQITMEEMGDGNFTITLTQRQAVAQTTLDALAKEAESGEPFGAMLWPLYNGDPEADEGLHVFHVQHGGIGFLPADDFALFNSLFLNLELRTGLYASCQGRIVGAGPTLAFQIDLARYGVCFNRCQRVLHERNAGAIYEA